MKSLHLIDVEPLNPRKEKRQSSCLYKIMHTELTRFPRVSGVPRQMSSTQTEAHVPPVSFEYVPPQRHIRWNKILGFVTLLAVSAGGWALIGLAIEKIVK